MKQKKYGGAQHEQLVSVVLDMHTCMAGHLVPYLIPKYNNIISQSLFLFVGELGFFSNGNSDSGFTFCTVVIRVFLATKNEGVD